MHLYTNLIHSRMAAPQRHHRSASFHLFRHQARSSGTKSPFQFFSFHPSTTGGGAPKVSDRDSRRHLLFYLFEFSFDTTHILMHERQEEEGPRTDWAAAGAKAMGSMDGWLPAARGSLGGRKGDNWPATGGAREGGNSVGSGTTTGNWPLPSYRAAGLVCRSSPPRAGRWSSAPLTTVVPRRQDSIGLDRFLRERWASSRVDQRRHQPCCCTTIRG